MSPSAWAFAFYPGTEAFEEVVHDSGYRILGAGVSTRAPVELI